MRAILAMMRAAWLSAASYRLSMVFSIVGLLVSVVPLYFISNALQTTMADKIQYEGGQYFGFVLIGLVAIALVGQAVSALPAAVGTAASSGQLDTLLSAPRWPATIFAGFTAYGFAWTFVRAAALVVAGSFLGARIEWSQVPAGLLLLALIVLAYLPFGLISTAMVVAFRTAGPIGKGVLLASSLLGGVYYPTHVVPTWLERISAFVPLTYGLRALRRVVLEGKGLLDVAPDVGMLMLFTVVLTSASLVALLAAFRYARRAGTLSFY